jgi:hypothetical protein
MDTASASRFSTLGRYLLIAIVAVLSTVLLHEFAHWLAGVVLGYDMAMSLNTVRAVDGFTEAWHATAVTLAGVLTTIAQAVVVYWLMQGGRRRWLYPFLLTPLAFRLMAMVMNLFNPNDEGRLSELLGLNLFVLPAIVCGSLLWLTYRIARAHKIGWKRNTLDGFVLVHLIGALIMLDQSFAIRLL